MPQSPTTSFSRWSLPVVAVAAGWLGGRSSSLDLAGEARAAAPPRR